MYQDSKSLKPLHFVRFQINQPQMKPSLSSYDWEG